MLLSAEMSNCFSSKVAQEHLLPTASQVSTCHVRYCVVSSSVHFLLVERVVKEVNRIASLCVWR